MFEFLQRILRREAAMTAIVREMLTTALQHDRRSLSRRERFRISAGRTLRAFDERVIAFCEREHIQSDDSTFEALVNAASNPFRNRSCRNAERRMHGRGECSG